MAGIWYRAGTVAVTNGSKKVVGTGTAWKSGTSKPDKGHTVWAPDGKAYELDYVESDTVLYLVTAYSGVTVSGAAYAIDISRSGTNSAFSRDLSAFVAYHQLQMDGWQQLLTGTGDVTLTAPDGTKLTVPSWEKIMNAGTGVVAQAKTEAQNAAASAAAAGNAVVAAALPLPDVWAPLCDSLRLITGYGRDVLVGSDVVARMVNFSRSTTATYIGKDGTLKTAAANEPRFEKDGLLIEGQSQNIIPISNFPQNLAGWSTPNPTGNLYSYVAAPDGTSSAVKVSFAGDGFSQIIPSLVVGAVYTFSFYAKNETATNVNALILLGSGDGGVTVRIPANTAWTRYSVTRTFQAGDSTFRWYFSTKNVEVSLWGAQLEALPFASSYIPTNGAAVTRAQDICWIPVENNGLPGLDNEKTVSLTSDIIGIRGSFNFILSTPWGGIDYTATHERVSANAAALNMNTPVVLKTAVRKAARFTKGGGCSAVFGGIKKDGPTANWSIVTTRIMIGNMNESAANPHFGHVKDLRIWLKPLSDDQMKAIA